MVRSLIGHKHIVSRHLNKKILNIFSGSSSATIEPNFMNLCNSIYELCFEGSAQYVHTVEVSRIQGKRERDGNGKQNGND